MIVLLSVLGSNPSNPEELLCWVQILVIPVGLVTSCYCSQHNDQSADTIVCYTGELESPPGPLLDLMASWSLTFASETLPHN